MKRLLTLLLTGVLLTGCGPTPVRRYTASFLDLFDTVTTVVGYAASETAFRETVQTLRNELRTYHQLFDIYHDYPGLANLKTVNDNAGIQPVRVDRRILALLRDCQIYAEQTGGAVNVAMGSVLALWHEARETGIALPPQAALEAAMEHCAIQSVQLDEAAQTVYLSDPALRLDVGAVAKGWAVQRVCEQAPSGLLVSVGGNVFATGTKPDGTAWRVGVQRDAGGSRSDTLAISVGAVVTSGDWQRYYTVDGVRYAHILDPATGYPARRWQSVTVICADAGLADVLSTALFVLPQAAGQRLLDAAGAEAVWYAADGTSAESPGYAALRTPDLEEVKQ